MNNELLNNVIDRQRKVGSPAMSSVLSVNKPGTHTGRGALRQCVVLLLSCALHCYAGEELKTQMQDSKPDPAVAIERARQGDPDELLRITQMVATHPHLLPARTPLAQYHQYLQDTNVFVQYFAVQVLAGLNDKSSVEPLRKFIEDTERRRKDLESPGKKNLDALGQKDAVALTFASETALMVLGEIDEDSPMSVKVLASQLTHDIPLEWGGGVAHSALAKKGRAGLRVLLDEAAQPMENDQERFLEDAINKIRDPTLAVDLYACCKDQKYNKKARQAALWALRDMAKESSDIEQMVISIAEDEKSDLRSMAIGHLGYIGSACARNKLLEFEKTLPGEAQAVQAALLKCDSTNRLPGVVEALLAAKTPLNEKMRLWTLVEWKGKELLPYADQLLSVRDENGVPLNDLRVRIWKRLYEVTKKRFQLELDADNELRFQRIVQQINRDIERELQLQYDGQGKYSNAQVKKMASEEAEAKITRWNRQAKKEGKQ